VRGETMKKRILAEHTRKVSFIRIFLSLYKKYMILFKAAKVKNVYAFFMEAAGTSA
jgi:hypothetical protein